MHRLRASLTALGPRGERVAREENDEREDVLHHRRGDFHPGAPVHLARIVMGWPVMIGAWSVPMWVSWLGLVVTAALAYFGFRLAKEA
jgi:hypothetical protein